MKALWISDLRGWESLRQPADLLLTAGARRRERAHPASPWRKASGCWCGARWPADCCPASTGAGRMLRRAAGASRAGRSRRSTTRTGSTTPSDVLVEIGQAHDVSAAQVALAYTAGQAGGDLGDRGRPDRGAAAATTWRPPSCSCRPRRSSDWTRSARCRCCTRTGIRPTPARPLQPGGSQPDRPPPAGLSRGQREDRVTQGSASQGSRRTRPRPGTGPTTGARRRDRSRRRALRARARDRQDDDSDEQPEGREQQQCGSGRADDGVRDDHVVPPETTTHSLRR